LSVLSGERLGSVRASRKGPRPTPLPLLSAAPDRPACTGMSELFDSLEPSATEQAQRVCDICPVQDWCTRETGHAVRARLPITGTWAGVAYSAGTALRTTGVADAG
jgi:hypothetical protein